MLGDVAEHDSKFFAGQFAVQPVGAQLPGIETWFVERRFAVAI